MIDVLVADPPWKFGDNTPKGRSAQYKRMPLERIMGLQLPPIGNNAVLFLWRCAAMQLEALQVAIAWGFVPTADLVWRKLTRNGLEHFGSGYYTRGSVETCVICVRGNCRPAVRDQRNSFKAQMPYRNGKPWHSAKPDEFYGIVERMYPTARKYELFARTRREGWWQHGNQLPKLKACPELEHQWTTTQIVGQLRCARCHAWKRGAALQLVSPPPELERGAI